MRKMSWNTFKLVLLFAILTLVFGIVLIEQCKAQSNPTIDTPYLTVRSWLKVDSIYVVGGVRGTGLDSTWVSGQFGSLVVDDSLRNEGTLRQKGLSTFGATSTPVTISAAGKVTATDTVVSSAGIRSNGLINGRTKIIARDSLRIGQETVKDNVTPRIEWKGDADLDVGQVTSESVVWTLSGNATPSSATWTATSTNSCNFSFGASSVTCNILNATAAVNLASVGTMQRTDSNKLLRLGYTSTAGTYVDLCYQQNTGLRLTATGDVGIGTTAPGSKLEVHCDKSTDTLFNVCNDRIHTSSYDTLFAVTSGGSVARNGATDFKRVVSLLDEGEYVMPTGIAGFGQCKATLAWVFFHFESDGTVTLEDHVNGSTTNGNDATLNVYDAGEGIVIENQLGGTLNVLIDITYYTP